MPFSPQSSFEEIKNDGYCWIPVYFFLILFPLPFSLGVNTSLDFAIIIVICDGGHCLLPNLSLVDSGFSSAPCFASQVHRNYIRHLLGISDNSDPLGITCLWGLWPLILATHTPAPRSVWNQEYRRNNSANLILLLLPYFNSLNLWRPFFSFHPQNAPQKEVVSFAYPLKSN